MDSRAADKIRGRDAMHPADYLTTDKPPWPQGMEAAQRRRAGRAAFPPKDDRSA